MGTLAVTGIMQTLRIRRGNAGRLPPAPQHEPSLPDYGEGVVPANADRCEWCAYWDSTNGVVGRCRLGSALPDSSTEPVALRSFARWFDEPCQGYLPIPERQSGLVP